MQRRYLVLETSSKDGATVNEVLLTVDLFRRHPECTVKFENGEHIVIPSDSKKKKCNAM
jgi:hypothetical protein